MGLLEKPIFVIGAARSGTYLVASTIARNFDVAYTGEVNELWKKYVPASRHDFIPADAATEEVCHKLRASFERLVAEQDGRRLLEKTPANSLRLPFVMQVFPDARIIHVIRDGRDVALSARRKYKGDHRKVTKQGGKRRGGKWNARMMLRIASKKIRVGRSPRMLLKNIPRYWRGTASLLGWKEKIMWGPRFPGCEVYFRTCSPLETAAIQWRESVESVQNFMASRPNMEVCEVRYEELITQPEEVLSRIFAFIATEHFLAPKHVGHDIVAGGKSWRDLLDEEEKCAVSVHIEHTLTNLGYPPTHVATDQQTIH